MRWTPVVMLALVPGCREIPIERWEPTDYDALVEALAGPEGNATDNREVLRWEFVRLREPLDAVGEAVALLDPLIDRDEGFAERSVDTRAVNGTNLFVHLACPGPNLDAPVRDFSAGRLRVESPELLAEAARKWRLREDILVVAEDCAIGSAVLRGASPGYVDEGTGAIALDVRFDVEVQDDSEAELRAQALFTRDSVAAVLRYQGESYAVRVEYSASDTLFIRGSDGTYVCDLDELERPCERISE